MARPIDSLDVRLISKVSALYYNYECTQKEIADRLEISRPKVSRLLKQAKKHGVVQITVAYPEGNFFDLESELEKKYNLNEVIVVDAGVTEEVITVNLVKSQLGAAAANYFERTVSPGDIIGITWGQLFMKWLIELSPFKLKMFILYNC